MAKKIPAFNNFARRTMSVSLGQRAAEKMKKYDYPTYFQFRIGDYQDDHYLYFKKKPTVQQYQNEIFNKMDEYFAEQVPQYLSFHYDAYEGDKNIFLSFLQIELAERMKKAGNEKFIKKFNVALKWVEKKQNEINAQYNKNEPGKLEEFSHHQDTPFIPTEIILNTRIIKKNLPSYLF